MGRVASFHLHRDTGIAAARSYPRLAIDRRELATVDGLRFVRTVGTGRGDRTTPGLGWGRTGAFAVWDDERDLDRFLATHPVARRWSEAAESWHVGLRLIGGHGGWGGHDVLTGLTLAETGTPVVVVTRASVRPGAWPSFWRASRTVDTQLHRAAGLVDVVGFGERPVGLQATFSVWSSLDDATAFAHRAGEHRSVIAATRAGGWYREELFARFSPYRSGGSWNGRDPVAEALLG